MGAVRSPEADFKSRGTARRRLRDGTQAAHAALDQALVPADMTKRPAYLAYLLGNSPFEAIETGLLAAGVHRFLPDWPIRERRAQLRDDFATLGVRPALASSIAIEPDLGSILGWSYVLEGSRLGGRLILQSVERSDDPAVRSATRFLRHGEGENLWGSFQTALSQIDGDDAAIERACSAANAAFVCFSETFLKHATNKHLVRT